MEEKSEVPEIAVKIYEILSNFFFDLESYRALLLHIESLEINDPSRPLWILLSNNCLMMATVEWCKIFGSENNNKTHYSKCIDQLGEIEETSNEMREFRDKYISHYDFYNKSIPFMDKAVKIVERFDQAMLAKYETDNQESTEAYIMHTREDIRARLRSIVGSSRK